MRSRIRQKRIVVANPGKERKGQDLGGNERMTDGRFKMRMQREDPEREDHLPSPKNLHRDLLSTKNLL